jgi:ribosome-associated heat shock protein Hsp15
MRLEWVIPVSGNPPSEQRLDKWLWHARLVKSRSLAAKLIEEGCIRINRQRVLKASALVRPGDVLTATLHNRIRVITITGIDLRRGPPAEARTLYAEQTEPASKEAAEPSPD